MKKNIFIIFIVFLFIACDSKNTIDESIVAKTKFSKVLEFEPQTYKLKTLKGKIIEFTSTKQGLDFKDYKRKKAILIDVFATWCPPCIEEIPTLNNLREKYKDDFEIVSILFEREKGKKELELFKKKYNISYPITIGEENFRLAKDLGDIQKVPEMFLFSKEGKFVKKFIGATRKEELEMNIKLAIEN